MSTSYAGSEQSSVRPHFNIATFSTSHGEPKSISSGTDSDYESSVTVVLPEAYFQIKPGLYDVRGDEGEVQVEVKHLYSKDDDLIWQANRYAMMGESGPDGEFILPWEAFTNNDGRYPAPAFTVFFPRRIATYLDDSSDDGRAKRKAQSERERVTGGEPCEEKVLALIWINRFLDGLNIPRLNKLTVDHVFAHLEMYVRKGSRDVLFSRVEATAPGGAYRRAFENRFLPKFQKVGAAAGAEQFIIQSYGVPIETEESLLALVDEALEKIVRFHVEKRRWIEPFWDGARTIDHGEEKLEIPEAPKIEPKMQPTLHALLYMIFNPLGIQIVRESNEGVGAMDFRVCYTTPAQKAISVGLELKLAHHKKIKHGLETQLPAYLDAIESKSGIYLVLWFKDEKYFRKPERYEGAAALAGFLQERARVLASSRGKKVLAKVIDASIRPSASNL